MAQVAKTKEVKEVVVEQEAPEVVVTEELVADEKSVIMAYFASVDALVKAEADHDRTGLDTIEMFEAIRKRLVDSKVCLAKEAPLRTLDSISVLLNTVEYSEKTVKRIKRELKAVFGYYEHGLSMRFRALKFTQFAKVVELHMEHPSLMTKSKIKACLDIYKNVTADTNNTQLDELNKKYAERIKNLITMVDNAILQQKFDPSQLPAGFENFMQQISGLNKTAINNLITGLRVQAAKLG